MSDYDFVIDLFNSCRESAELMTIEDAAADLEYFRGVGWKLPEDITPEEYAETWNSFVNANMTVYGRPITQKDMDIIGTYMDDDIRETVHAELAPCSPEEFISRYLELDPDFEELLKTEFSFER